MKKFNIKKLVIGLIVLAVFIVIFPIIMYLAVDQCSYGNNNIDKSIWLSFWGTYIGACVGGVITCISLVYTAYQYQEETQQARKDLEETRNKEKDKYMFEIKRQLLASARPLLVIEPVDETDIHPFEEIHRYVYGVTEDKWCNLRNYDEKRVVAFKVRNIGEGPAENVNIRYASSIYNISGYNDRMVRERKENAPMLLQKMSFDVPHNDYVDVSLTFHFSKKLVETESVYLHELSFDLVFNDYRNNEIQRTITVDLDEKRIVGWDSQKYSNKDNQSVFDGIFEKISDLDF